jgi:6-phosphogluconolactonase (cycloisomerase 2 family)
VYSVNTTTGALTEMVNSPYATSTDPISVLAVNTNTATTNSGGVFVYVGSQPTASGALSIFQMCTVVGNAGCTQSDVNNALLVPVTTPAPPATGQNPVGMAVDPTNAFLYVVCYGQSAVYGYHINNTVGTLTALTPANQQTGAQPVALALHPSVRNTGQFLYTSNSGSTNISGFTLSTTSGSMSSPISVTSPSTPSGMAAR